MDKIHYPFNSSFDFACFEVVSKQTKFLRVQVACVEIVYARVGLLFLVLSLQLSRNNSIGNVCYAG